MHKTEKHSEIYVKVVKSKKKSLCQSMWWKDIYLQK